MPRPNPAQLAYGSATVMCSTLAMLLLSETRSGVWIAVIAFVALALGLLVALTAPSARPTAVRRRAVDPVDAAVGAPAAPARPEPVPARHRTQHPASTASAPAATAGLGARR
ncbi:hypothetical protein [Streptomyces spirodelae]|uniref:Secreted protein n=1 Tax=Streptomyces spirodelae TaxID=2812904 RepID=A0ABS3WNX7_9ACTN|nr:hypothetical protein [Streptomyces spirodelae]MBO8184811.1 hypothetical protein [Streptomyces spirodelae]